MSINGNNIGGQYPANPLTTLDQIKIWGSVIVILAVFFSVYWWSFR